MAKFDKFQVMAKIAEAPMVPVFYKVFVPSSLPIVATSLMRFSVSCQSG